MRGYTVKGGIGIFEAGEAERPDHQFPQIQKGSQKHLQQLFQSQSRHRAEHGEAVQKADGADGML